MTIAEDFWLRSQAAQTNIMQLANYNAAVMGTAALQAMHMALTAPTQFWAAMARASTGGDVAVVSKTAEIVAFEAPVAAPKPAAPPKPKPAAKPKAKAKPAAAKAKPAPKPAPVAEVAPVAPAPVAEPALAKATPVKPAPVKAAKPKPAAKPKAKPAPNPLLLDAPRDGKGDDLTALSGIGPKLASALNEFGIYHFDQIAGLNEAGIAWLNSNQKGFAMTAERFDLVAQAKAKAKADK